jgi:hypothetical protein
MMRIHCDLFNKKYHFPIKLGAFLLFLMVFLSVGQHLYAQFAGGDGTAENPFLIQTATQLDSVRNYPEQHFRLVADIDLNQAPYNEGTGWIPIGSNSLPFRGHFDGGNHAIRNLMINRPETGFQGLFGDANGALLDRIVLDQVDIVGRSSTGGIAGRITGTVLSNSRVSGEITGMYYVGGAVGEAGNLQATSYILYVSADVTVRGNLSVGGLVGASSAEIRHSWTQGSVFAETNAAGGLVGHLNAGTGRSISDTYSHASVTGTRNVGGLVGAQQTGDIHRSFSTGAVSGDQNVGGLIGDYFTGNSRFSFWNTETSGQSTSGGNQIAGKTTAEMYQRETYAGYNMHTAWEVLGEPGYPTLRDMRNYPGLQKVELSSLSGAGTEENPYLITTPAELHAMRQDLEAHYRLGSDINLAASVAWNNGLGWEPVGTGASGQQFTGSLDGNGFEIRNLTINRFVSGFQGLFGDVTNAEIRDVRLAVVHVSGASYTGGLAGRITGTVVNNSSVSGEVVGRGNYIGGVIGASGGTSFIHYVSADVSVMGDGDVGGLIGSGSAQIRHSWTIGSVFSRGITAGGLVGHYNASTSRAIADSYSHASVSGLKNVGGLVGYSQTGDIFRSFSTGAVRGDELAGGLIGYRYTGSMMLCFWDVETSGQDESAGGDLVVGKTTAEMRQRETFRGYNFFTLWTIREGSAYPEFQDLTRYAEPEFVSLTSMSGAGTEASPYIITTAAEMAAMRQDREAHYRLGNDIDLSSTVVWNHGLGWIPVGTGDVAGQQFKGSLDGAGFEIRNLTINRPTSSYHGVIGDATGADFRNIRIIEGQFASRSYAGLFVGRTDRDTKMENIRVSGEIVSVGSWIGGLAGSLLGGTTLEPLRHLSATANLWGNTTVGGLAGHASAIIEQAWSEGTVVATGPSAGGLIGHYNAGNQGLLQDSYSHSKVTGLSNVGGFVGSLQTGNIRTSFSTGYVTGNDRTGGFAGDVYAGTARYVYWNMETSGQETSAGGEMVYGRTTEQMTYPYTENVYSTFNFIDIWRNDNGGLNDGYPYQRDLVPVLYAVSLSVDDADRGTVSGAGDYRHAAQVTLHASAHEGWVFVHWTEGDRVVSESASYSFAITSARILKAHFTEEIITGIDGEESLPVAFALSGNYPNPFNSGTVLRYALPVQAEVVLEVYDVLGRRVAVLVNGLMPAGRYEVRFDASGLSSGVYLGVLRAPGRVHTHKMMHVK